MKLLTLLNPFRKAPPAETTLPGITLSELLDRKPQVKRDARGRYHVAAILRDPAKPGKPITAAGSYHITVTGQGVKIQRALVECSADFDALMDGLSVAYIIYCKGHGAMETEETPIPEKLEV
jgi:hypothetical protein